jgi:carboxylesterase
MASSAARADRGKLVGTGDPGPISVAGREPTVFAFHGFGGTSDEVRLVTDVARVLGLAAIAPLLPGHGTHANELAKTRFADWRRAAEQAFEATAGPAIVCGLSMGSLLATHLATTYPERVRGLVLLANAFWLKSPFPALPLAAIVRFEIRDFRMPKVAADIADPEARRTHLTYGEHPVHAAADVQAAGVGMRPRLADVRAPTLIVHGARDRVCDVRNVERVRALLGARDVKTRILPRSRHIITRDLERRILAKELEDFFRSVGVTAS